MCANFVVTCRNRSPSSDRPCAQTLQCMKLVWPWTVSDHDHSYDVYVVLNWNTYLNIDTTKWNTVITWSLLSSGVDLLYLSMPYTLRHVTTKFAHMNGHWKAYNHKNLISRWVRVTICYKLFSWSKILIKKFPRSNWYLDWCFSKILLWYQQIQYISSYCVFRGMHMTRSFRTDLFTGSNSL